jgi:hypothetical protein
MGKREKEELRSWSSGKRAKSHIVGGLFDCLPPFRPQTPRIGALSRNWRRLKNKGYDIIRSLGL